jgi:hypothetical protein
MLSNIVFLITASRLLCIYVKNSKAPDKKRKDVLNSTSSLRDMDHKDGKKQKAGSPHNIR